MDNKTGVCKIKLHANFVIHSLYAVKLYLTLYIKKNLNALKTIFFMRKIIKITARMEKKFETNT